ncbi:hypothetical protein FBU31_004801, partial [Coemansia sp. 'formosensis']
MTELQTENVEKAPTTVKTKPSRKRQTVAAKSYRRSVRLGAKAHLIPEAAPQSVHKHVKQTTADIAKEFYSRLEDISKQLSLLAVGQSPPSSLPIAIPAGKSAKGKIADEVVAASFDSDKTLSDELPLYPITDSHEKDICRLIFAPTSTVPKPKDLRARLRDNLSAPIPIHHFVYNLLKPVVDADVLDANFCIAEEVGNICPTLTPC